jgi:hypothetical protein
MHAWSRGQKWLIIVSFALLIALGGSGVYVHERSCHRPGDSILVGTWQLDDGCVDCTHFINFQPNHDVIGFSDAIGREYWLDYHGHWYAASQILVIHYDTPAEVQSIVMRILDVSRDTLLVRWNGREMRMVRCVRTPPRPSNRSMKAAAPPPDTFSVFAATANLRLPPSR